MGELSDGKQQNALQIQKQSLHLQILQLSKLLKPSITLSVTLVANESAPSWSELSEFIQVVDHGLSSKCPFELEDLHLLHLGYVRLPLVDHAMWNLTRQEEPSNFHLHHLIIIIYYIYTYMYHSLSLSVINSGLEPIHTGTQSSSNLSTSRMRRLLLCKYFAVVYRNFNMQIPNITKLKRILQVASRQLHPLLLGPRDPSGSSQVTCLTPRPNTHDVSRAVPHPLQLGHSAEVGASSRSFYVVFIGFILFPQSSS